MLRPVDRRATRRRRRLRERKEYRRRRSEAPRLMLREPVYRIPRTSKDRRRRALLHTAPLVSRGLPNLEVRRSLEGAARRSGPRVAWRENRAYRRSPAFLAVCCPRTRESIAPDFCGDEG